MSLSLNIHTNNNKCLVIIHRMTASSDTGLAAAMSLSSISSVILCFGVFAGTAATC